MLHYYFKINSQERHNRVLGCDSPDCHATHIYAYLNCLSGPGNSPQPEEREVSSQSRHRRGQTVEILSHTGLPSSVFSHGQQRRFKEPWRVRYTSKDHNPLLNPGTLRCSGDIGEQESLSCQPFLFQPYSHTLYSHDLESIKTNAILSSD